MEWKPVLMQSPPTPVNCSVTAFLRGSILDTGVPGIVTQTPSSPAAIHPPSPGTFTGMVAVTWLVCGSIRETLPSDWFRTQTAPSPGTSRAERPG